MALPHTAPGGSSLLSLRSCAPEQASCGAQLRQDTHMWALTHTVDTPMNTRVCAHTDIHTHTQTHTQRHSHTHRHTHRDTFTHTHTHRDTHRDTFTHMCTYTDIHTHTDTHRDTFTHMCTHTHRYSHTDTDTHTDSSWDQTVSGKLTGKPEASLTIWQSRIP